MWANHPTGVQAAGFSSNLLFRDPWASGDESVEASALATRAQIAADLAAVMAPSGLPAEDLVAASSTTNTISGTSMASPHTAGAAAKVLQGTPTASPDAVGDALEAAATRDQITNTGETCQLWILLCRPATPNVLLFSN